MPSMNGIELSAGLRGSTAANDVPILVVTGRGRASDWRVLNAMGVGAFLLKPVEPRAFIEAATKLARPITTTPIAMK
jgi:DNA-binding response OmpR family regulator